MTRRTAAAALAARELSSPEPEVSPPAASGSKTTSGGGGYKLQFADALLPKSGAASSSDALLRKLKALHAELSNPDLDIDALDLSSFEQVKDDLVRREILFHKDPGVKAFAACCIADLLRFYAPDAPYSPAQVEDIFAFFLNLLAGALRPTRYFTQTPLATAGTSAGGRQAAETRSSAPTLPPTKNEFYAQYFYLVESVATCKSIILCLDTEEQRLGQAGADESGAVRRCFEVFFDVVRCVPSSAVLPLSERSD
jgi:sister-chromatid-cohesion protein PDS5